MCAKFLGGYLCFIKTATEADAQRTSRKPNKIKINTWKVSEEVYMLAVSA